MAVEMLAKLTETQRMIVYIVVFGLLSLIFAIFCGMVYPAMILTGVILALFSGGFALASLVSLSKLVSELLHIE